MTIPEISEAYAEIFWEDAIIWLATPHFQDLELKEQFEVLEFADWRNIIVEYQKSELDGGKLVYSGKKDKDFNFYQLLKDIEK